MTDDQPTLAATEPSAPAGAVVTTHLHCIGCHYDLHGQPLDGKCPECGWEVETTIRAFDLDHAWLLRMRAGLRWLLASMYLMAFFAGTGRFDTMDSALIVVMLIAAAQNLIIPNPNHPREASIGRWAMVLLVAALAVYLAASIEWWRATGFAWNLQYVAVALHAAGLAMLWWRVQTVSAHGLAPRTALIARNLALLTGIVGALTVLPPILWQIAGNSALMAQVQWGLHLLWLLALVVWALASVITLHLMAAPLRRLIDAPHDLKNADAAA